MKRTLMSSSAKQGQGRHIGRGDRPKRIVILSQFYTPEPHRIASTIANTLAERGYEISVVTGYPNRPEGKLYPGYKQRLRFTEIINGIPVHRVPLIVNYSRKALERISNFLTFSFSALTVTSAIKNADLIYVYGSPATAAIPAQIWQKTLGIPYVVHVQDLWPESVTDSGMVVNAKANTMIRRAMHPWLKRAYGNAAGLIAISPGMKQLLIDRGNKAERCSVVYNWALESTTQIKPEQSFAANGLRLLYGGNFGMMQDLETVIKAARTFDDHSDFRLEFAGGGTREAELRQAADGSSNIDFLGRLSKDGIAQKYLEADFQLVTLKDIPIFRTTIPSKLQSSLSSGVPVITTVQGDVAQLITEHQAGLVADPENPESLAQAFRTAYNMSAAERAQMGANARKLYVEKMSQHAAMAAVDAILTKAIEHNPHHITVERSS